VWWAVFSRQGQTFADHLLFDEGIAMQSVELEDFTSYKWSHKKISHDV